MGGKARVKLGAMPAGNLDAAGRLLKGAPHVLNQLQPFSNGKLTKLFGGQMLVHAAIFALWVACGQRLSSCTILAIAPERQMTVWHSWLWITGASPVMTSWG